MAMKELLEGLKRASENFFWAFLYADGLATSIRITYHPEGQMEIHSLPWEDFRYVLLSAGAEVFRDSERRQRLPEDIAKAFQICRLWDPRVVTNILKYEEELTPGRWRGAYDIEQLAWGLHEQQVKWLQAQPGDAFRRPIEFAGENGVLTEMTEEDFSGTLGNKVTLQFDYKGRIPPFVRPV